MGDTDEPIVVTSDDEDEGDRNTFGSEGVTINVNEVVPVTDTPSKKYDVLSNSFESVRQSTTHPKFLHSNSTSHIWAFGAIAELIDNAADPDVLASNFHIDLNMNPVPHFSFSDDGLGMSIDKLHRMCSFGYSMKEEVRGHKPIGQYGNGFKSGSMRLGKDAIVFTKNAELMSLAFLSQTFLEDVKANAVLVPMVSWDLSKNIIGDPRTREENLRIVFKYSFFQSEEKLHEMFNKIPTKGTIIVVFNLRKEGDELEFDISEDPKDIRLRGDVNQNSNGQKLKQRYSRDNIASSDIPLDYSLREYCSVLYLRPKMKIFIRGYRVKTKLIEKSLSQTSIDVYKPKDFPNPVNITFGLNVENKNAYGMMMYNRNRLIKAYLKVGIQIGGSGKRVIGIIEADFLQPTHNKQDFDFTPAYRSCIFKLSEGLKTYWKELKSRHQQHNQKTLDDYDFVPDAKRADSTWAQCEKCLKWRRIGVGIDETTLPDKWYCSMNSYDPQRATCFAPEEKTSVDEVTVNIRNVRKKQKEDELRKKKEEKRKSEEEEAMRKREQQGIEEEKEKLKREQKRILEEQKAKELELKKREEQMKKKEGDLKRKRQLESEKEKERELEIETNNVIEVTEEDEDAELSEAEQISNTMVREEKGSTVSPTISSTISPTKEDTTNPKRQKVDSPVTPIAVEDLNSSIEVDTVTSVAPSLVLPQPEPFAQNELISDSSTAIRSYEEALSLNKHLVTQVVHYTSLYQQSVALLSDVSGRLLRLLHAVLPQHPFPNEVTAAWIAKVDTTPFTKAISQNQTEISALRKQLDLKNQELQEQKRTMELLARGIIGFKNGSTSSSDLKTLAEWLEKQDKK